MSPRKTPLFGPPLPQHGRTWRHGIKVGADGSVCSMEEVALAVGQVIGRSSVRCTDERSCVFVFFVFQTTNTFNVLLGFISKDQK